MALPFSLPVYAADESRAAEAEGGQTDGNYSGGASNYTNINSDDGDTSYLSNVDSHSDYDYHCYDFQDFSTAHESITSVTLYIKRRNPDTSYPKYDTPYCRIGSVNYYGTQVIVPGSYITMSKTWATNPSTGSAWTQAGLNAAEFGQRIKFPSTVGSAVYTTYMYLIVTYVAASAPSVTTSATDNISCTSVTLEGTIDDNGGATITNYGFVWDTTSRADPGNTAPTASAYANSWEAGAGTYSEGDFSHFTGATLAEDTAYRARFAAYNSQGWSYGSEVEFDTFGDPTVLSNPATSISATTARLQSYVSDDGDDICQVRWGYGKTDQSDNITAYDTYTTFAGSYSSGESPYLDVTGLDANDTYYFNIEIQNDCGTDTGTSRTFDTKSGVGCPTNIIAIPDYQSVVLSWMKGDGATNTVIRYKMNDCPDDETDGTLLYLGSEATYTHEGLTSGVDYCYYFVGQDPDEGYSSDNVTIHATTLASGTVTASASGIDKPDKGMTSDPSVSDSLVEKNPIFKLTEKNAETTGMPHENFVYLLALFGMLGLSYFILKHTHSIEVVAMVWVVGVGWIAGDILDFPYILPIFVFVSAIGYGIYKMRSVV